MTCYDLSIFVRNMERVLAENVHQWRPARLVLYETAPDKIGRVFGMAQEHKTSFLSIRRSTKFAASYNKLARNWFTAYILGTLFGGRHRRAGDGN